METYLSTHAKGIGSSSLEYSIDLSSPAKNTSFLDSKILIEWTNSTFKWVQVYINYINRPWYLRFLHCDIRLWRVEFSDKVCKW